MNKQLISALLLLCSLSGFTQDILISEGYSIRNDDTYHLIGKIKNQILLFVDKFDDYEIIAFDEDMQEQWDKKVAFDSKRAKILHVTPSRRDFTIVYRYNKRGKIYTQAVKMDEKAEILAMDTVDVQSTRNFFSKSEVLESEDKRYLLIYETEMETRIHARVFDMQEMKTIWRKVFTLQDMDINRDFVEALLDNTGQPYFIFNKDNRKAKREENRFLVTVYNDKTGNADNYEFSMKGKVWFDVKFEYDNMNKRLMAAGLYSEKRYNEARGYFYMNIDLTSPDDYQLDFEVFDSKFIVRAMGKSADKINGISDVSVQDIVLRRDGGLLMIVERNREHERRVSNYTPSYAASHVDKPQVDYHFEDILLLSVHPDGSLHWAETLQKRQFSQDDDARFSSYFLMHSPRNLRFLYNDEIRPNTNVNEYTVNGKGRQARNNVYNAQKENIMLLLPAAVQVAANELIVPSERRSTLKLVRIVY